MQEIKVTSPDCYGYPKITGKVGNVVEFIFRLNKDWIALYDQTNNNTHKICGVKDLTGWNSVRLGVRKSADPANKNIGLVAVAYQHRGGKIYYPKITTAEGKTVILRYDTWYRCRIERNDTGTLLILMRGDLTYIAAVQVPVSINLFPRLSGLYVEPSVNVSMDFDLI